MQDNRCNTMRSHYFWNNKYSCLYLLLSTLLIEGTFAGRIEELTSCQHLQLSETRRAKALSSSNKEVRIPRCNKLGHFEPIQCSDEQLGTDCWCVDEYGFEIPGTRNETRQEVQCHEPEDCPASNCRMFCASGFDRDPKSGCRMCRCKNPCDDVECPNGESCQLQEVKCKNEPCPPMPTCKKGRSIENYCTTGFPLSIEGSIRPFLCGLEPGKPECPPLYNCMVESGNDYGVCCPNLSIKINKPGVCPPEDSSPYTEKTGYMCGTPCSHDLECKHSEKCCFTKGCKTSCQQPVNVTNCQQARVLSDILSVNEREGRGYIPDCNGPGGTFSPKQCSRNGLVCWCVDPRTGYKIKGSMGAAYDVKCDEWENSVARSLGRSFSSNDCDYNVCAAVCEYGFKNDHNGCPTCECSEPCEGFKCPSGSHCEVAADPLCASGSALCSSWPICKPDFAYSNPCESDTPLQNNITGEILYCFGERQTRKLEPSLFFDDEPLLAEGRSMTNQIMCPLGYKCTKLHGQSENVCCPVAPKRPANTELEPIEPRQQSMCEYLRDFSKRMEGTEKGMQLAIPPPECIEDGSFQARQCTLRQIKVTRAEQRKIMEENAIRNMRMLIESRTKRDTEGLRLHHVDDVGSDVTSRDAKFIDNNDLRPQLFENNLRKTSAISGKPKAGEDLVVVDIQECWCVDSFGTEIPNSRGTNVTEEQCADLRESIDCLELTCRMGCDYGFDLDPETRCPACHCRDPCSGVSCGQDKECRIVDVSCDNEYCPPVPACLPRKPGQCPFLVPPGPNRQDDGNFCSYECRTDSQCEGSRRCCSNGCGTQCVEPQMKTACQHLKTIQMHQASELGMPARQMHVARCDEETGKWEEVQCGPENVCWCVDSNGQEISGTRVKNATPVCERNSAFECPTIECPPCEYGYKVNASGCPISCECRNLCDEITCLPNEICEFINVECVDNPCPKMPICVPIRDSICPEGGPLKQGNTELSCGPYNEENTCPTTHTCQLNPVTHRGVCCAKTRDVCFESVDHGCLASIHSTNNLTYYRFSPKVNKCVPVSVDMDKSSCQTKNIFRNEQSCASVCPVLMPCERLKLKNSLVAKRSRQAVWFEPRCDPVTGHWSPVQCLGNQSLNVPFIPNKGINAFVNSLSSIKASASHSVCWCADKKGAPLKGTLTRDQEPVCNSRQARKQTLYEEPTDPLMEDLIEQMTILVTEEDTESEEDEEEDNYPRPRSGGITPPPAVDRVFDTVNSIMDSKLTIENVHKQTLTPTTRCLERAKTAPPSTVSCDENGAFLPMQCNKSKCWCVDAAGNQLSSTSTFLRGTRKCLHTPIDFVAIELFLLSDSSVSVKNLYDIIKSELHQYTGESTTNFRVQENTDGAVIVSFELHDDDNVDKAFLIENAIQNKGMVLGKGHYTPDINLSKFLHKTNTRNTPVAQNFSSPENTIQLVLFILATSSAFVVSLFVIYVMLKRGKPKVKHNFIDSETSQATLTCCDKKIDLNSPIFVLSADDNKSTKQDL